MSFFRSIWTDLVEKRLLPVVALLVIALVAIPFVLTGKKDSSTTTPIAAGPINPPADAQPADLAGVKLVVPTARHGAASNRSPFTQPHVAAVKVHTINTIPTPTNSGGNTGGGNGGGGNGGGGSTPFVPSSPPSIPPTTTKPAPANPDDYRVTLRVGQAGDLNVHKDVERLTPLPSTLDPFFVFMGVTDNGKTAVFLVSSDAKATGDGTCKPTPTNCQTVEMKVQDVEFFDVDTSADGSNPVQYELDLTRIIKKASTSSSSGSGSSDSSTAGLKAGQQVVNRSLQSGSSAITGYAYDPKTGELDRRLPTLASELSSIASRSGN
jgi:hypothetical protein